MAIDKNQTSNSPDEQTRILPKNFRQIGEPGAKKIYMEDYVYTYLNKLAQPGNLYARGAILFGKMYKTAVGKCLFISGAAACQNFEFDLEETVFSEETWSEIYRIRDSFFPDMEISGWFLSRMGFSVELNDKIIRTHMDNFNGENKILFMIDALENEDAFYQFENYSLKKQKGYYIYYETNKEMKNYMLAEGEMEKEPETKRRSNTILRDTSVVKNYKKAMKQKKSLSKKGNRKFSPSSLAGALVMIMVLLYGAHSIYQFRQSETAQEVFDQRNNITWEETTVSSENTTQTEEKNSSEETTLNNDYTEEGNNADQTETFAEQSSKSKEGQPEEDQVQTESVPDDSERSTESAETAGADVFTQEEPDDVEEAWNYIGGQYTVKQGDTLAAISKNIYQSYEYVDLIAEANQIVDIDHIYPGQILQIPAIED